MGYKHRRVATHCRKGHLFTGENTLLVGGSRTCKICSNQRCKEWKAKKRRARGAMPVGKWEKCKRGHLFSGENLGTKADGSQYCKDCNRRHAITSARRKGVPPRIPSTTEKRRAQRVKWESKRRALIKGRFVENVERGALFIRDYGVCGICKCSITGKFEVDHIIPISRGGEHSYKNTQIAHPSCNRKKYISVAE